MSSELHLQAFDLQRSFHIGKSHLQVLRGISLTVSRGEAVFLCGASGAGKTTLLYTLAGLERPEGGRVEFEGHDLYALGDDPLARLRNQRMGFIFQSYFLLPELTALENVILPSMMNGQPKPDLAKALLERVGLKERINHLPSELSGGEQQRVAIARALVHRPRLLLADEPTGNLDDSTGEQVRELLFALHRGSGTTLVLVTHDLAFAARCQRVLQLHEGRLREGQVRAGRFEALAANAGEAEAGVAGSHALPA